MEKPLNYHSASELRELLKTGQLSASELAVKQNNNG